jgi:hypothetical protein
MHEMNVAKDVKPYKLFFQAALIHWNTAESDDWAGDVPSYSKN